MERTSTFNFKLGGARISVDVGKLFRMPNDTKRLSPRDEVLHYHAKHELFFIGHEPLTVYHEGGSDTFCDCILCIPAFVHHRTVRSAGDTCMLFSFAPSSERPSAFCEFAEKFFGKKDIFIFTTASSLTSYIDELFELTEQPTDMSDEVAIATLQLIFYNIMDTNAILSSRGTSAKESYLLIIENIVNSKSLDPTAKVDLGMVAEALHLSRRQTARTVYKYFGTTLAELVNEKRMAVAELLLSTTNMPISEVATHAGFATENYFFIKFKKAYGISPLVFRNNASKRPRA